MSSFTDRCEQEDETDRLALVRSSQVSLAYDHRSGRLLGQVCNGALLSPVPGSGPRKDFVRLFTAGGYVDVHVSTITLEDVR